MLCARTAGLHNIFSTDLRNTVQETDSLIEIVQWLFVFIYVLVKKLYSGFYTEI